MSHDFLQTVYLIYTCSSMRTLSKEKLSILGGSSGGLLVGACLNQRPDLFAAGVAKCGTMDILRFHRYTIGHAWIAEYGCSDNKEDFDHLIKISPMHNVPKDSNFPAVLVTTADHDDRVVPHHTLKYLATVQSTFSETIRPIMGRISTRAGHGFGKSTKMASFIQHLATQISVAKCNPLTVYNCVYKNLFSCWKKTLIFIPLLQKKQTPHGKTKGH